MNEVISVRNVSKIYENANRALEDISFSLSSGNIMGLLGRNGGGKTTLINIINSMISEYSGEIYLFGENLKNKSMLTFFKQHIAYLPDKDYLYTNMTPKEMTRFFKDFFHDFREDKAEKIFRQLNINANQKISTMSKGQAEKVGIALTLSRDAKLYIFDEPLAGADVISRDEIFIIIRENCLSAATIIATHLISSVENILDCALFLNTKCMAFAKKEELLYGFNTLEDSFRYYAQNHEIKPLKQVVQVQGMQDIENKDILDEK